MSSELTSLFRLGLKAMSMAPVVASNAKMWLRTMLALAVVCRTVVNVPPAMILLPTWVIAFTEPFMTCGVNAAGIAETSRAPWSTLTAAAGVAAIARVVISEPAAARATSRRRAGTQRDMCGPPHAGAPSLCSTAPTRPHDSKQPRGTLREVLTTPTERWRLQFGQSRMRTLRGRNSDPRRGGRSRTVMVIRAVGRPRDWSARSDRPRTLELPRPPSGPGAAVLSPDLSPEPA